MFMVVMQKKKHYDHIQIRLKEQKAESVDKPLHYLHLGNTMTAYSNFREPPRGHHFHDKVADI